MPQLLGEIGLLPTNSSTHNALSKNDGVRKDDSKARFDDPASRAKDRPRENGDVDSNKENVSRREECNDDDFPTDDCDFSVADCDPCSDVKSLSQDFFGALTLGKATTSLPELPHSSKLSHNARDQREKQHHIIVVLQGVVTSHVPDLSSLQEIMASEDLETSIREAYGDALVPCIYDMMLRHKTVEAVQILGAQLLQKTVMSVPKSSLDIGRGNGIQLLVHSMLSSKDSVAVQTAASATLAALCSTTENRIIAGKFFVVETILDATQEFRSDKYLQGACMKLLTAIASESENSDIVVDTKSIRLPLRVIRRHGGSPTIVRMACECARQVLKSYNEDDIEKLSELNVMRLFLCVMLHFADDERTQTAAIGSALLLCSVNGMNLKECVKGRAADLCVRNLKRFRGRDHWKLHLVSMELLCLFAEARGHRIVVNAGALEASLTSMIEMRRVFAIQSCCLLFLEHIVSTEEEPFLQRIIKAGGIDVLNTSLKAYISREDFVERGVRVMRSLKG